MKVAFDIDQVLCMIVQRARVLVAQELGATVEEVILTDEYDNPFAFCEGGECLPIPVERSFWDRDDLLATSGPALGAAESLHRLHAANALAGYVTRRPPHTRAVTEAWLKEHGFPELPVHFVGTVSEVTSYAICKSTVCRNIGATHLVDDHATEISSAASAGIEVIVVDADTGRAARDEALSRHPGATRAMDACDAVRILEERLKLAA